MSEDLDELETISQMQKADRIDETSRGKVAGSRRAQVARQRRGVENAHKPFRRWARRASPPITLHDPQKTAVISQRGMGETLGMSGGRAFPRFLASKAMAESLGAGLREKMENPLRFQIGAGGAGQPPSVSFGFDVTLLIDICNAIIAAESGGKLTKQYARIARQAHVIVGASAKSGIQGLVYRLAGYNPTAEEVIAAFKLYVQEEARKYEPEFPSELYVQWYRLYKIPEMERGKPWHFKYLTVNHIYYPLAQSSGKIFALLKAHKASGGNRAKKLFQFLNEIGARALGRHLGRVLEMAESSPLPPSRCH